MADYMDQAAEEAADAILHHVLYLRDVLRSLPIPVDVGTGVVRMGQIMIAVQRATALAEYEPMPEEQQDHLRGGCIMWLCAVNLLASWDQQRQPFQVLGVFRCLEASRVEMLALAEWLTEQENSEE